MVDVAPHQHRASMPFYRLRDAQIARTGYVVFRGDGGSVVYAVFPARDVHCDESALLALLAEVDAAYVDYPDGTELRIEARCEGELLPGSADGAVARSEGWVHPQLVRDGWHERIRQRIGLVTLDATTR
ncbi:hypothetical protein [Desertivibrio insolitus]|uniref:hypothetical protein n=1 Tax=Herbiconiux sp. SYSU D00978 TaxID=2812562 RepID=UPI001A95BC3A|nr:hypothetical protein [Herbiconiux sp. SYSU D00978]